MMTGSLPASKKRRRTTRSRPRTGPPAASKGRQGGELFALEVRLRVADGSVRDEKRVGLAGTVSPPRGAARERFPGVRDRELAAKRLSAGARADDLARLLAAIAHPQRITILLKLLACEATHKLLAKATGLKAGPLYYHLRELRAARLIGPKVRDLYVLTTTGRRVLLGALGIARLCR